MATETAQKITVIALFVGFTIIRAYYRRLASARVKALTGRGPDMPLIGLLIPFEVITLFGYLLFGDRLPGLTLPLPTSLRWFGAPIGLMALPLLAWAHHSLGRNFSVLLSIHSEHTLVTDGPYRWVRHPIYVVFYMIHLATFLLTANWFIGITWLTGLTLVIATRVRREERMLADRFGQEYLSYAQSTGRFLPRIRPFIRSCRIGRWVSRPWRVRLVRHPDDPA